MLGLNEQTQKASNTEKKSGDFWRECGNSNAKYPAF